MLFGAVCLDKVVLDRIIQFKGKTFGFQLLLLSSELAISLQMLSDKIEVVFLVIVFIAIELRLMEVGFRHFDRRSWPNVLIACVHLLGRGLLQLFLLVFTLSASLRVDLNHPAVELVQRERFASLDVVAALVILIVVATISFGFFDLIDDWNWLDICISPSSES